MTPFAHSLIVTALLLASRSVSAEQRDRNFIKGTCVSDYDEEVDYFPHKSIQVDPRSHYGDQVEQLGSDYSLLWSVEYHGSYKVLTNSLTETTYVLWQCGTTRPNVKDATHYVEVPLTKAAATTTMIFPWLEMLGERESLVAYKGGVGQVTSPCLTQAMDEGLVETNADADAMQSLGVEITFADEWSVDAYPNTGYFITAQSEGVVDSSEKTVLKQAEYLEVIALFFNREHEAAELMKDIVARYACTTGVVAAIAAAAPSKPKVLWAAYNHDGSAGGWTVSDSCPSYHCEFVAAAGGELITSYAETVGETMLWGSYPYLSNEQFLAGDASKADVIIFADDIEKYDGLLESLATLKAVANGRMFDLAARRGPGGGFDWFESRIAHPDVVLADIAAVLHPETELAEEHAMQYLHKCGTPIESLSESCDDLSAPTELFAELLPQCSHLADGDEDTLEPVIEVEDEDAAGERGSVARVVGTFVVVSSLTAALL